MPNFFLRRHGFHNEIFVSLLRSPVMPIRSSRNTNRVLSHSALLHFTFTQSRFIFFFQYSPKKSLPVKESVFKVSSTSNDRLARPINSLNRRSQLKIASLQSKLNLANIESTESCSKQSLPLFKNIHHPPQRLPEPRSSERIIIQHLPTKPNSREPSKSTVTIVQNFQGNGSNRPIQIKHTEPSRCKSSSHSLELETEMGQDVGSCCAKYILCLFNFIFFVSFCRFNRAEETLQFVFFRLQILGSLVLGLGLWLLLDKNSIVSLLKSVSNEHVEVS